MTSHLRARFWSPPLWPRGPVLSWPYKIFSSYTSTFRLQPDLEDINWPVMKRLPLQKNILSPGAQPSASWPNWTHMREEHKHTNTSPNTRRRPPNTGSKHSQTHKFFFKYRRQIHKYKFRYISWCLWDYNLHLYMWLFVILWSLCEIIILKSVCEIIIQSEIEACITQGWSSTGASLRLLCI